MANVIPSRTFSKSRKSGQQVERLKDVAHLIGPKAIAARLAEAADVKPVDLDEPLVGPSDPRNDVQQRRLPAATATDEHDLLARGHVEPLDIEDREHVPARLAKRFFYILHSQHDCFDVNAFLSAVLLSENRFERRFP